MALISILFILLLIFGTPIVFSLGIAASFTLVAYDIPLALVAQRIYGGLDKFTIMAIPFFILTGIIMEKGGIAKRIIDLATALVGWITGSLYLVAVVAGTGLAAISGSGSADTAAMSSMMLPEMKKRNYNIDFAAAIMACSGSLGTIIPPSIMMVVLATISNQSVGALFLAGIIPGLLCTLFLLMSGFIRAKTNISESKDIRHFSFIYLIKTFIKAIPALTLPVIIVGGIVGGIFTPTEAASVAVIAGLLISLFIYREIKFKDLPVIILKAATIASTVMLIIATANIFSWFIASQQIPQKISDFMLGFSDSKIWFLVNVNLLLLLIGMFMESISAILILVPVLMPVAIAFGVDPLHFGLIIILNLSIGMITPPYGITLFVASSIAERSIIDVSKKLILPLSMMLLVLILATYFPKIALYLPTTLLGYK
jgi:C4-dicarboxylate transporter, DctM subunit|tara:strand:+ start:777 stop:2060 length:1284 start_codon:yes stop_codon:yes gene_type:complete